MPLQGQDSEKTAGSKCGLVVEVTAGIDRGVARRGVLYNWQLQSLRPEEYKNSNV
jgi:hypothetical protein